jgi:hypothetical protein
MVLAALLVSRGDTPRQRNADGRKREVDGSRRECVEKSVRFRAAKKNSLCSRIVSKHGEDDLGVCDRILRRWSDAGIAAPDGLCFPAVAVPKRDVMTVLKKQTRDRGAHPAEAEKGKV